MTWRIGTHITQGITMPGLPLMVFGRNPNIAWANTYGFMDMMDYFIEECRDGELPVRRGVASVRRAARNHRSEGETTNPSHLLRKSSWRAGGRSVSAGEISHHGVQRTVGGRRGNI